MKKTGYYLGLLLLVCTVFGCTDEKLIDSATDEILITGTVDTPTRTSYAVGEQAVSVSWNLNDEIGLLTKNQPDALCYKATSNGKQTGFQPASTALKGADGDDIYAYYPYISYKSTTYPYAPLPYIAGQNYRNGLPDPTSDFMYAQAPIMNGKADLHFKHLFSFLKLNIRTELLENAKGLLVVSREPITYTDTESQTACFNLKEQKVVADQYFNYLWYYFSPEDLTGKDVITCFMAVLPTTADNVISIFIYDNNDTTEKGLIEKKAPQGGFQAGHTYNLSVNENGFNQIEQQEREALTALYQATGGANWQNRTNWGTDQPLSEWYGVNYWDGHVRGLSLQSNGLTGTLPDELAQLTALESLYLGFNQLSGNLPESMASLQNLKYLYLGYNNLSGTIPESFAGWMNTLETINLSGNSFTGKLPEAIVNHPKWKDLWNGWICSTLDLSGVTLPAPDFTVTGIDGKTISSAEEYSRNKLTAVLHWWSLCPWSEMYIKNQLMPLYNIYHEKGFEIIGYSSEEMSSLRSYVENNGIPWKNFQYTTGNEIPQLLSQSTPTIYLIDQQKEVIFQSITQNRDDIQQILTDHLGDVDLYTSTDYSRDGEVITLQKATQEKGIDIVFLGEAFVDKDMGQGGLYEQTMKDAMEQYFAFEPLKTLRNRFNVYAVKVVSPNAAFLPGAQHRINENPDVCFEYAKKVPGLESASQQMISVIYNKGYSGRSYTIMYTDGSYIGFMMEGINDVLNHEVCGHGLGKLQDEYVEGGFENQTLPQEGKNELDNIWQNWKWGANVDWRNDPATVKWAHFLKDSRYDGEGLGLYEGAYLYGYGAYRPTENSMMRYNDAPFNAPSREQLYKTVMQLSEGSGWTYRYEDFVQLDAVSRAATSRSLKQPASAEQQERWRRSHRAPVRMKGTWRDAMKQSGPATVPFR